MSDPTAGTEELAEEFGFIIIQRCQNAHQRPKVEEYTGYYFIVLYEAELEGQTPTGIREPRTLLGKNYLVTVRRSRPYALSLPRRARRGQTARTRVQGLPSLSFNRRNRR